MSFPDLLGIASAKLIRRCPSPLSRGWYELLKGQLTECELGRTERYAEIEHKAPAEHLLHEISHHVRQARLRIYAGERVARLTPSIGLIGILKDSIESGRVLELTSSLAYSSMEDEKAAEVSVRRCAKTQNER